MGAALAPRGDVYYVVYASHRFSNPQSHWDSGLGERTEGPRLQLVMATISGQRCICPAQSEALYVLVFPNLWHLPVRKASSSIPFYRGGNRGPERAVACPRPDPYWEAGRLGSTQADSKASFFSGLALRTPTGETPRALVSGTCVPC